MQPSGGYDVEESIASFTGMDKIPCQTVFFCFLEKVIPDMTKG